MNDEIAALNGYSMKNYLLIILVGCSAIISAQLQPIDHSDYDSWNRITGYAITNYGDWMAVETSPLRGDSHIDLIRTRNGKSQRFERASNPNFTADGKWLFFKVSPPYHEVRQLKLKDTDSEDMPKDHLVRVNLRKGSLDTVHNVSSFEVHPNEGAYISIQLEDEPEEESSDSTEVEEVEEPEDIWIDADSESQGKGFFSKSAKRMVIWDLDEARKDTFHRISSITWAENVAHAALVQSAGDSTEDAQLLKWEAGADIAIVDTAFEELKKITFHKAGNSLAWLRTSDSSDADVRYYNLMMLEGDDTKTLLEAQSDLLTEGWMISPHNSVIFSENAESVYFGTMPVPFVPEEDSTILDNEKVSLDIWSWTDEEIQPMQKLDAEEKKTQSYTARLDLTDGTFVQLEDEDLESVYLDPEEAVKYAVGVQVPHEERASLSWHYPTRRDFYLVNIQTGERQKIVTGARAYPSMSPSEKYVYWWDGESKKWKGYRIEDGQNLILSANVPNPVYNEEHDTPNEPGSYGSAGWTENDEEFVLYDAYDIWKVVPGGAVQCITQGKGRANEIRYRYNSVDRNETHLPADEWYLYAFDEKDKSTAYVELDIEEGEMESLIEGDFRLGALMKADSADVFLYRRETFEMYPELYVVRGDNLEGAKKVTHTNPQQSDYRWGTAELVEWITLTGIELEGLLYKPEDFDPNKKYPVLVYFYETYSDQLHAHRIPSPSASVINFPYFLSHEYIIFVPDIVYEEGHPGRSAEDCILSGVEMIATYPWVDASNMAIQGQSWGGYQVAHLVTRTNVFKCAMAGAPVSNMTSAYGGIRWGSGMSRAFQYERTQSRIGGTLWERRDLYIENSPVFFADQVNTPLLMMHNDGDGAVPWYQGIEYFMALRRLNKPVWMLVYNDEEHNLMQRHNRMDLSIRMGQFFHHYLKGEPAPEWLIQGRPFTEKEYNPATNTQ